MAFYEIRQYEIRPGKMEEWIRFFDEEIVPFQVARGMVIAGSFRGEEDDSVFFWLRRFESEDQRKALYAAVYEDEAWKIGLSPRVGELMNREAIKVSRVTATAMSVLR